MNEGPRTLKEIREDAGLTLEQFADKIGYSKSTAGGYELREPSEEYLRKVSEVFKLPTESIRIVERGAEREHVVRPDVSWMLAEYDEKTVVEKLYRVLMDDTVPLDERVRRAEVFLGELRRRASSSTVEKRADAFFAANVPHPKPGRAKPQD